MPTSVSNHLNRHKSAVLKSVINIVLGSFSWFNLNCGESTDSSLSIFLVDVNCFTLNIWFELGRSKLRASYIS